MSEKPSGRIKTALVNVTQRTVISMLWNASLFMI